MAARTTALSLTTGTERHIPRADKDLLRRCNSEVHPVVVRQTARPGGTGVAYWAPR